MCNTEVGTPVSYVVLESDAGSVIHNNAVVTVRTQEAEPREFQAIASAVVAVDLAFDWKPISFGKRLRFPRRLAPSHRIKCHPQVLRRRQDSLIARWCVGAWSDEADAHEFSEP